MSDAFKVEFKGSVEQWVSDLIPAVAEAQAKSMLPAAEMAAGAVRASIFEAFPGSRGGMARSYTATLLRPKDGHLRSGAVSDLVYARIQDEGGTITPKNAKALTIPISDQAKRLSERGIGARAFPAELSLVWPKGRRTGMLVESMQDRTKLHYVLSKRVTLPGKNYLDDAAQHVAPLLVELFDVNITKAGKETKAGGEQ